ncbi:MFS transporter [Ideonella sp. DXS29W]|uniref:MFS transporter n=1 Tax=Ideonella lacteola TaxID=2984193 RepID=A0ABU9BUF3_9BURK
MNRTLRHSIVLMSAFACFSDAVLIAFYPQFFAERFGMHSELHTGAYVACISLAVMLAFPLWAQVARRVDTLRLLVWTQAAAGALCLASIWAPALWVYWLLSMAMFVCKSSYLLMYPYLLRLQSTDEHAATVGLLSVIVHLVGIAGAAAGGALLQGWGATGCLVFMAAGDLFQMAVCAWLLASGRAPHAGGMAKADADGPKRPVSRAIWRLSWLVLMFDLSAYLVGPFFTEHWQRLTGSPDPLLAGLAYAVPAGMALLGLAYNHLACAAGRWRVDALLPNLLVGAAGLMLQAAPSPAWLLIGRCLFGWALFQGIVMLETRVFKLSTPKDYATDYAFFNVFQNLGVLVASLVAGWVVQMLGAPLTFTVAAIGWLITAVMVPWAFGTGEAMPRGAPEAATPEGAATRPAATHHTPETQHA